MRTLGVLLAGVFYVAIGFQLYQRMYPGAVDGYITEVNGWLASHESSWRFGDAQAVERFHMWVAISAPAGLLVLIWLATWRQRRARAARRKAAAEHAKCCAEQEAHRVELQQALTNSVREAVQAQQEIGKLKDRLATLGDAQLLEAEKMAAQERARTLEQQLVIIRTQQQKEHEALEAALREKGELKLQIQFANERRESSHRRADVLQQERDRLAHERQQLEVKVASLQHSMNGEELSAPLAELRKDHQEVLVARAKLEAQAALVDPKRYQELLVSAAQLGAHKERLEQQLAEAQQARQRVEEAVAAQLALVQNSLGGLPAIRQDYDRLALCMEQVVRGQKESAMEAEADRILDGLKECLHRTSAAAEQIAQVASQMKSTLSVGGGDGDIVLVEPVPEGTSTNP